MPVSDTRAFAATALAAGLLTAWRLYELAASQLPLFFDEAQYWSWAQAPAFGYYSKPPVVAWMIAAATAFCGDGEACIRAPSPLTHFATTLLVYRLGTDLRGPVAGAFGAVLFATLPGVSVSSMVVSTDVPLMFFWAAALVAFNRALLAPGAARWWLLLGASVGLGTLSKYAMLLFVPCAAAFVVAAPPEQPRGVRRGLAVAAGVAILVVLPNAIWNAVNGFASIAHAADNLSPGGTRFNPAKLGEFVGAQFAVAGPLVFATILLLAARTRATWSSREGAYLAAFCLPVIALVAAQSFAARAHANWAAVAYVSAAPLVAGFALDRARWVLTASLAIHVASAALVANFDRVVDATGIALRDRQDPFRRMRGWDSIGVQVGRVLAEHPDAVLLADDRDHMAELLYYARPYSAGAVKWNPDGRVRDHYDLVAGIGRYAGDRFVLATREPGATHVLPRFAGARRLPDAVVPLRYGGERRYELYLLEGYKG